MALMIATYVAGNAEDSETYEADTPFNVDVDLRLLLTVKYYRNGLPSDFRILSVYDVETDQLIEFDEDDDEQPTG